MSHKPLISALFPPVDEVFSFLLCLQSKNIKPHGGKWLTPKTLNWIASILNDKPQSTHSRTSSERSFSKIHSVHYLALCAGLVSTTSGYLKPTPKALLWVEMSEYARLKALWNSVFEHETYWIKLKLPGWKALQLAHGNNQVFKFEAIRQNLCSNLRLSDKKGMSRSSLLKLIPSSHRSDAKNRDSDPETLINHLVWLMGWFGATSASKSGRKIQMTRTGIALLEDDQLEMLNGITSPSSPFSVQVSPVRGEKTVKFVSQPGTSYLAQYSLCDIAPLAAMESSGAKIFTLNRDSVVYLFEAGLSAVEILAHLKTMAGCDLPRSVPFLINKWLREHLEIRVYLAPIIETSSPATMDTLTKKRGIRQTIHKRINPTTALIKADQMDSLIRRLRFAKLGKGLASNLAHHPTSATQTPPASLDAFHLYACARIANGLLLTQESGYRAPQALIRALASQISPDQRLVADDIARRALSLLRQKAETVIFDPDDSEGSLPPLDSAARTRMIHTALAKSRQLVIMYDTAGLGLIRRHVIKPLRLESVGDFTYLAAILEEGGEEYLFRVDRILGFDKAHRALAVQ